MTQKCGYVALLGRPNAGKSTLLNAVLKAKIAVVSAKPQTTRNRILGVHTEKDTQIVFLDTPGMHKAEKLPRINNTMNRVAWSVLREADLICYLVDADNGWHEEDGHYLKGILEKSDKKILLLATKVDASKKDQIQKGVATILDGVQHAVKNLPEDTISKRFLQPLPNEISAKRPESVADFRAHVAALMPEGPWLFAEDDLTDLPQQFICGEIIREQIFRQMSAELPYSCAVKVDKFTRDGKLVRITATLIVQRENHKGMLIGKGGSRIKVLGQSSRESLEKHLGEKVFLELFVKVQEGWIDSASLISEYASLQEPEA